jgi:hypothetical protein
MSSQPLPESDNLMHEPPVVVESELPISFMVRDSLLISESPRAGRSDLRVSLLFIDSAASLESGAPKFDLSPMLLFTHAAVSGLVSHGDGYIVSLMLMDSGCPGEGGPSGSEAPSVISPVLLSGGGDSGDLSALEAAGANLGESPKMKTVWISLSAVIAVSALVVVGIILFCHSRRRKTEALAEAEEADIAIPIDVETSLEGVANFLSEQNALSHDRDFSLPKRLNGEIDDSFLLTRSRLGESSAVGLL